MYKKLEAELVLKGMGKKELAAILGVQYNTILAKCRGDSSFTLDEALKTKEALKTSLTIEELFEKEAA